MLQASRGDLHWVTWGLNPFEVREVLQAFACNQIHPFTCLNPFEVREVLQAPIGVEVVKLVCLNPFEVREVLQGLQDWNRRCVEKSQSL